MTEELDILETYVAAIYKADQTIRDNILVDQSVMGRQIRWFYTNNSEMDKNIRPSTIYRHVIFCKDWRKLFVLGNYEPRRWLMPYGIATHTINGDVYLSKNMQMYPAVSRELEKFTGNKNIYENDLVLIKMATVL